jgi:hypothetical protein
MRVGSQRHVPTALPPGKRADVYCTGDWVGPRAGLDVCRKSRPHRDSSRTFHPLASRYVNYTIPPCHILLFKLICLYIKSKVIPYMSRRQRGEWRHRTTQSEPWHYAEVSDQCYAPAGLPLVSPHYIICVYVHIVLYGYVFLYGTRATEARSTHNTR